MRNVLCKLPESARPILKRVIQKVFTAGTYWEGFERLKVVIEKCREAFLEAMKYLVKDLEESLASLKLSPALSPADTHPPYL